MSVAMKTLQQLLDAVVNRQVTGDIGRPLLELGSGRKLAVHQQVRRFEISAFLGEFVDFVAAIAHDSLIAIDVGDSADTRGGVGERRIVSHHPEIGGMYFYLAQIQGANRVLLDRDLVSLSGAV